MRAQVLERARHLVVGLAETDHDAALGLDARAGILDALEQLERAIVTRARAHHRMQARDGLDVVIDDLGARVDDALQVLGAAAEVGDQDLDDRTGALADLLDDHGEDRAAAILQIIARHRRDDRVTQVHPGDGLGDATWLVPVHEAVRLARGDRAETAAARAQLTQDHDRGGAARPAVTEVRTARLLAHRDELLLAQQRLRLAIVALPGELDLEPWRQTLELARRDTTHTAGAGGAGLGTGGGTIKRRGVGPTRDRYPSGAPCPRALVSPRLRSNPPRSSTPTRPGPEKARQRRNRPWQLGCRGPVTGRAVANRNEGLKPPPGASPQAPPWHPDSW